MHLKLRQVSSIFEDTVSYIESIIMVLTFLFVVQYQPVSTSVTYVVMCSILNLINCVSLL